MSGGGGRSDPIRPIAELQRIAGEAADAGRDDSGINAFLDGLLHEINARDIQGTRERIDDVLSVLVGALDGAQKLLFGGSVAKHTYVDGLSDIDALLVISEDVAGTQGPAAIRDLVADALRHGLGADVANVSVGNLAVTVRYTDGREVQLLPAVRRGTEFEIADASGTVWTNIRPRAFARKLSEVNAKQNGIVIRGIKIAKALISGYAADRQLTGYHVESLAIEAFENYDGPQNLRAAVAHFFEHAAQRILSPIVDSTGQSVHVDDHLGLAGSVDRQASSDSLARTARRLGAARTPDEWRNEFPD